MFAAILSALSPILGKVVSNLFPDPADELKRLELQNQFQLALMAQAGQIEKAASDIVLAEAQSENWLASSWRPIMMLTFGSLIVARWLGFTAPGVTEAVELKLWSIIELGLGGYVLGRSAEKIAPSIAAALKK